MVKPNKSKKVGNPTEFVPANLNPAKKPRVSESGEEKESLPRQARKPKVYLIEHGFDESPKNWDFDNEEGEFSDDDDEDSRHEKKQNIVKQVGFMRNWARTCSAKIRGQFALTQPFHSYGSAFNNSIQLFGAPELFLEDYEQELARRVLIMRKLFLEEFQDQIHLYVKISDELAEGRDMKIPNDEAFPDEITAAGWTLGEWKMVMRRLTRILIVMGRSDNFAYAYMIRRPNFTFEELLKEDEYPDSDDDDFNAGERD